MKIKLLIAILFFSLQTSCEGHEVTEINLTGDSIAYLNTQLAEVVPIKVVNSAIGGDTTCSLRERWNRDILMRKQKCVYIHIGVNDLVLNIPIEIIKENFIYFAQSCADYGMSLIIDNIAAVPYQLTDEQVNPLNNWLEEVLHKDFPTIVIIDYFSWAAQAPSDMFYETDRRIHPSDKGYLDFANYSLEELKKCVLPKI